ncbi:MAG: hypothetical protein ABIQ56_07050 [Chitinophagaceae bacterium]
MIKKYFFVDEKPLAVISYYRIKQTDDDGSISYTSLEAITISHTEDMILLAENPSFNPVIPGFNLTDEG